MFEAIAEKIVPYPKSDQYLPYRVEVKLNSKRTYVRGLITGLIAGFLIGLLVVFVFGELRRRETESFEKGVLNRLRSMDTVTTVQREKIGALKEENGNEIAKRTIAENRLRKMGVKP